MAVLATLVAFATATPCVAWMAAKGWMLANPGIGAHLDFWAACRRLPGKELEEARRIMGPFLEPVPADFAPGAFVPELELPWRWPSGERVFVTFIPSAEYPLDACYAVMLEGRVRLVSMEAG